MKALFLKYREQISYLFFGGCTFVVSMVSFWFFNSVCKLTGTVANIPSTIIAVLFAYIVNKLFVFEKKTSDKGELLKEFISFIGGRIVTFFLEEAILYVGIDLLHVPDLWVKFIAQFLVILSNYFISKFIVFKK